MGSHISPQSQPPTSGASLSSPKTSTTSPRTSLSSPATPFSPTINNLQKVDKRSPTYSAFAYGVKTESEHAPARSPFHPSTISPSSKQQKHIKTEPITDSYGSSPSSGRIPTQNRKPSTHDAKETNEISIQTEESDISSVPLKKDPVFRVSTTKKNNEDPTKRAVISQEETDQAVTALLGESFENSFESSTTDLIGGTRGADRHHTGSSSIIDDNNMANLSSEHSKTGAGSVVTSDIGSANPGASMVDQNETQCAVAGIVDDSDEAAAAVAGLAQEMSPAVDSIYGLQSSPTVHAVKNHSGDSVDV
jgi:hypothetical protein